MNNKVVTEAEICPKESPKTPAAYTVPGPFVYIHTVSMVLGHIGPFDSILTQLPTCYFSSSDPFSTSHASYAIPRKFFENHQASFWPFASLVSASHRQDLQTLLQLVRSRLRRAKIGKDGQRWAAEDGTILGHASGGLECSRRNPRTHPSCVSSFAIANSSRFSFKVSYRPTLYSLNCRRAAAKT